MLASRAFPFRWHGALAQMTVMRNNGFCWGRIVTPTDGEYDVTTSRDHYERSDEDAAAAFIRAARRPENVGPAQSWPWGWQEFAGA